MLSESLFPFLAGLTEHGRAELCTLPTTRVGSRCDLLRRGDSVGGAYLVVGGSLRVYYITDQGREATLYRVESGQACVLALSAALRSTPYPAWVQSDTTGGEFACIPEAVFRRLVDAERAFRSFVLESLSERVFELMCTLEQLATSTVLERVASYIVRRAGGERVLVATQEQIAAELGTAREVVFRALRELTALGLVTTTRGRIAIDDLDGLSARAARA